MEVMELLEFLLQFQVAVEVVQETFQMELLLQALLTVTEVAQLEETVGMDLLQLAVQEIQVARSEVVDRGVTELTTGADLKLEAQVQEDK
jgi:hypothetical protein